MSRILIADGDGLHADIACQILKLEIPELGVVIATDALEALRLLQKQSVDLLLIDQWLADKEYLVEAVHEIWPATKFIMTADEPVEKPKGFCEIIYKPYDIDAFVQAIKSLLG